MAVPTFFSGRGVFCCERIWNSYIEIQWNSMQVIFVILLCTQGYNSLGDPTRQRKVWRKILLQADPIERLTACVLATKTKQNSTIQFNSIPLFYLLVKAWLQYIEIWYNKYVRIPHKQNGFQKSNAYLAGLLTMWKVMSSTNTNLRKHF